MSLYDAVHHAFSKNRPASDEESSFLKLIYDTPGISARELRASRGGKGIASMIGRMVGTRSDSFHGLLPERRKASDILLKRSRTENGIRYRLHPQVAAALKAIGLV